MSDQMAMLRCYDCGMHAVSADETEAHRAETRHQKWTSITHNLHPQERIDDE